MRVHDKANLTTLGERKSKVLEEIVRYFELNSFGRIEIPVFIFTVKIVFIIFPGLGTFHSAMICLLA